jgi:hypothetical protein
MNCISLEVLSFFSLVSSVDVWKYRAVAAKYCQSTSSNDRISSRSLQNKAFLKLWSQNCSFGSAAVGMSLTLALEMNLASEFDFMVVMFPVALPGKFCMQEEQYQGDFCFFFCQLLPQLVQRTNSETICNLGHQELP